MSEDGPRATTGPTTRRGLLAGVTAPRFGLDPRAWQALVAVTVVALLARLVVLGARTAHFDEARVAYWTLRYAETGHFEYRYIIHGPLAQHVNSVLFPLLGATDFVMRLPVALVGGLLPLSAVLFRDHLRDEEVVGLALFLALNPILLYYSRFFRSDVLVAGFVFVAFGFLVRLLATRKLRYLHATSVFAALAFASKENAIVYLIVWIGASALLVDTALFRPRHHDNGLARLTAAKDRAFAFYRESPPRARRTVARVAGHLVLAVGLFAALTLFMYAPRAGDAGRIGLWAAVADPTLWPAVLDATVTDLANGFGYWFGQTSEPVCFADSVIGGYVCFLGRFLGTMGKFAASLSVLAVGGFLLERYTATDSRPLVMFAGYWGFVSVLGYPLGTDVWGAWVVTHAVVPLAIPAAVGFGHVLRYGTSALAAYRNSFDGSEPIADGSNGAPSDGSNAASNDSKAASDGGDPSSEIGLPIPENHLVDVAVAGLLILVLVGGMIVPAVGAAYQHPQTRDSTTAMVQYAQPAQDMGPGLAAMHEAVQGNEGTDVVYYGGRYYLAKERVVEYPPAADVNNSTAGWFHRLPLPWYTEAADAEVRSARAPAQLQAALADDPPVVISQQSYAADVRHLLDDGYRTYEYDLRAHIDGPNDRTSVVIFVDESRLSTDGSQSRLSAGDSRPLAQVTDSRAPAFQTETQLTNT